MIKQLAIISIIIFALVSLIPSSSASFSYKWTGMTGVNGIDPPLCFDVNNDGIKEIFIAGNAGTSTTTGRIVCLDGLTGALVWTQQWTTPSQDPLVPLAIGDLDGNGDFEIVHAANDRTYARNCEDGSVLWNVPVASGWHHLIIADTDRTGHPYVFITMHGAIGGPQKISKLRGSDGAIIAQSAVTYPCYGGISAADLDSNGEYEIILSDASYGGGITCFDENLVEQWNYPVQDESSCAVLANVNADAYLEVVQISRISQANGGAIVLSPDGTLLSNWGNKGMGTHLTPTIYDIDKDGHTEFISAYGQTIKVLDLSTGNIDAELHYGTTLYRSSQAPIAANVYGDAALELIVDGSWDGAASIWDSTYTRVATLPTWGGAVFVTDIENDGKNEILFSRPYITSNPSLGMQIICYDTDATTISARSDTPYYSERRTGAEVYYPTIGDIGIGGAGEELTCHAGGPYFGQIGQSIQFLGTANGGTFPYTWTWTFGDGNTSLEQNPTHTYHTPGIYDITLMVIDDNMTTVTDHTTATITEIQLPELHIGTINGGFGINTLIKNTGPGEATNVACSTTLTGGIFIGKVSEKVITHIPAGAEQSIKSNLIFGIGKTTILVTATCDEGRTTEQNATGFILGPFVLVVK